MEPINFGQIFSEAFGNFGDSMRQLYYFILRTSPLPDWLDFLLVVALFVVIIRMFLVWMSPRR